MVSIIVTTVSSTRWALEYSEDDFMNCIKTKRKKEKKGKVFDELHVGFRETSSKIKIKG